MRTATLLFSVSLLLCGCTEPLFVEDELTELLRLGPLGSPPADSTNAVVEDPDAAALGQFIFFDPRFSRDGTVSCASCHDPAAGLSDGLQLSAGAGTTGRHAPSVWNTSWNRWFFWDGRADSHWSQALGPMESPVEAAGSRLQFAHLVYDDPELRAAYENVFGLMPDFSDMGRFPAEGRPVPQDPQHPHNLAWESMDPADRDLTDRFFSNIGKAIGAYEHLLVTPNAPLDRYLARRADEGHEAAAEELSRSAMNGLKLFVGRAQCVLCHHGPTMTDFEFHNIGLGPRTWLPPEDPGRFAGVDRVLNSPFNATGPYSDDPTGPMADELRFLAHNEEQIGQFKTPSLRQVASNPPYMHGGHFATLEEVVVFYNELDEEPELSHREESLVPLELSDQEVADLVTFLEEALTGEEPEAALLRAPAAP